jgi:hypothetical protein
VIYPARTSGSSSQIEAANMGTATKNARDTGNLGKKLVDISPFLGAESETNYSLDLR